MGDLELVDCQIVVVRRDVDGEPEEYGIRMQLALATPERGYNNPRAIEVDMELENAAQFTMAMANSIEKASQLGDQQDLLGGMFDGQ